MPKYGLSFTLDKHHNNGYMEIEACSEIVAEELLAEMPFADLLAACPEIKWEIDIFDIEEIPFSR